MMARAAGTVAPRNAWTSVKGIWRRQLLRRLDRPQQTYVSWRRCRIDSKDLLPLNVL
jgi:hypothetical protein